jgi:hypothetical protein
VATDFGNQCTNSPDTARFLRPLRGEEQSHLVCRRIARLVAGPAVF